MAASVSTNRISRVWAWIGVVGILAAVLVGCSKSRRQNQGTGGNPPPSAGPATLTAGTVQFGVNQTGQVIGRQLTGLVFTLQATNGPVEVTRIPIVASGTVNESIFGEARLVNDGNSNGVVDPGEQVLVTVNPGFATANGTLNLDTPAGSPIVIQAGQTRQFIVTLESAAVAPITTALVAQTLVLQLSATGFQANAPGSTTPIVPGGSFGAPSPAVSLGINDHVLISELFVNGSGRGTSGEFIEIFNATGFTVNLSDYYLSNVSGAGGPYYNLPQASGFGPQGGAGVTSLTFIARFPANAQIGPGAVQTVAMDGVGFNAAHTQQATYALRNPGAGTTPPTQMRVWNGNSSPQPGTDPNFQPGEVGDTAVLNSTGDSVFLFFWDFLSDLVTDIDLVNYGTADAARPPVDKTGVSVDGPDGGAFGVAADATQYAAETPVATQNGQRAPAGNPANGIERRLDSFQETGEARGAAQGNGVHKGTVVGHDETSEPFHQTFQNNRAPSPGTIPP